MRRIVLVAVLACVGIAFAVEPANAAPPDPDGWIKKAGGNFKGVGIFDPVTPSPDQTVTKKVTPGDTAKFSTKAENTDGLARDLRFAGPDGTANFKPKYFVGDVDVTTDAIAGLLQFDDVPAGGTTASIKIKVKVKGSALPGSTFSAPVKFYDPMDVNIDDNLQYRVKVV